MHLSLSLKKHLGWPALALGAAVLSVGLTATEAAARPARCEIVQNNVPIYAGPCEYRGTDSKGSFRVTAPDIMAQVYVYGPGEGDGGDGFGQILNNTHSGSGQMETLGAVYRDGGCWGNRTSKICAWADQADAAPRQPRPPQQAQRPSRRLVGQPTHNAHSGLYVWPAETVSGWELIRIANDPQGRNIVECQVTSHQGNRKALQFRFTPQAFYTQFSGYGSAVNSQAKVVYSFDNEQVDFYGNPGLTWRLLPGTLDGRQWLASEERIADGPTSMDTWMNFSSAQFTYLVDGRPHTESFSLRGSNAAIKAILNCF